MAPARGAHFRALLRKVRLPFETSANLQRARKRAKRPEKLHGLTPPRSARDPPADRPRIARGPPADRRGPACGARLAAISLPRFTGQFLFRLNEFSDKNHVYSCGLAFVVALLSMS